jgi:NADP-dependent 3-hydroxy acid dehydrogenase YdfG
MQSQGYGRFVFIASSAGLFGQPQAAHYAAAKAGTLGLANVIALEGAEHGILANCVLPFGYSRMVTESVGEFAELPEVHAFLRAIEPEYVVPIVVFLASRACELTHHSFSASAGGSVACSLRSAGDGCRVDASLRRQRRSLRISEASARHRLSRFRCRSSTRSRRSVISSASPPDG